MGGPSQTLMLILASIRHKECSVTSTPLSDRLLAEAEQSTKSNGSWYPHAGLMQLLLWDERPAEAATLAELTIFHFRNASPAKNIIRQDFPFSDALLAERRISVFNSDARTKRLRDAVADESVLGRHLRWLAGKVDDRPLDRLVSGYNGWDEPVQDLGPAYVKLAANRAHLTSGELRKLWVGAYGAHDLGLAEDLAQRYGRTFPFWHVAAWFAGSLVRAGDVSGAQEVLLAAREPHLRFAVWDLLPLDPVLQSTLRRAATPEFRQTFSSNLYDLPWQKKR